MSINKQILITCILLISSIVFFALSSVDVLLQDLLFDAKSHTWLLAHNAQPYKFLFYDGIKKLIIIIAVMFLFSLLFYKKALIQEYRKGIMIVVLSAIFIPVVVGGLKKYTNMPCPKHEIYYGGKYPRTAVWESYEEGFTQKCTQCWPAGHASGGFAFLSLFFLFKTKKNAYRAAIFALILGWSMGIYKMLIGDHFFSHTLITMLLAWLIVLLNVKLVHQSSENFDEKLIQT